MEPNSEAFEGPTASIWIDFHFVTKSKDELTKNHRGTDKEKTDGIMPETPGSEFCPVRSFEKYINKLHPSRDRLWQRPKNEFDDSERQLVLQRATGRKNTRYFHD